MDGKTGMPLSSRHVKVGHWGPEDVSATSFVHLTRPPKTRIHSTSGYWGEPNARGILVSLELDN